MYREDCDLLIIGGGAAGIMAALAAAPAGKKIRILEAGQRPLRKVQASGDGRCNLGNGYVDASCYDHGTSPLVQKLLADYDEQAFIDYWQHLGVPLYQDERKRFYPETLEAQTVVQALLLALEDYANVGLKLQAPVEKLSYDGICYEAFVGDACYRAEKLIFATGSPAAPQLGGNNALPLLADFNLQQKTFLPAIASLQGAHWQLASLKGLRLLRPLRLYIDEYLVETVIDDVLFLANGLSGTAAFALAAAAENAMAAGQKVRLGLVLKADAATSLPARLKSSLGERSLRNFMNGYLPKALIKPLLQEAGFTNFEQPANTYPQNLWHKLLTLLLEYPLYLEPQQRLDKAQAAQGGIALNEINPQTLALKKQPSFYLAGEVLDVTGICGGYNLLWAYLSGQRAGRKAADL